MKQDGNETGFYKAKLATARFYMTRILPQTSSLFATIMAGKKPMMVANRRCFEGEASTPEAHNKPAGLERLVRAINRP